MPISAIKNIQHLREEILNILVCFHFANVMKKHCLKVYQRYKHKLFTEHKFGSNISQIIAKIKCGKKKIGNEKEKINDVTFVFRESENI